MSELMETMELLMMEWDTFMPLQQSTGNHPHAFLVGPTKYIGRHILNFNGTPSRGQRKTGFSSFTAIE